MAAVSDALHDLADFADLVMNGRETSFTASHCDYCSHILGYCLQGIMGMGGYRWGHRGHVPPPNQWPTEVVGSGRFC